MDRFHQSFKRWQCLSSKTTFVSQCIGTLDILSTSLISLFVLATNKARKIHVKETQEVKQAKKLFSGFLIHYSSQFSGPMVIQRTDKRFQLAGIISWGKQSHVFKISQFADSKKCSFRYRMCWAKSTGGLHKNIRIPRLD